MGFVHDLASAEAPSVPWKRGLSYQCLRTAMMINGTVILRYLGLFWYKLRPPNDLPNLHNILPCFHMYNHQVLVNKMDILQYRNLHTCYWIYCNPNAYSCSKKSCITMHYHRCLYFIRIDQWFQIFVLGGRWLRVWQEF